WGDGIYINGTNKDIKIIGGILERNRRNGISIISGSNILIKNTKIENTFGHLPCARIDIEPNMGNYEVGRIDIKGVMTSRNKKVILINLSKYLSQKERKIHINIDSVQSKNDNYFLQITPFNRSGNYAAKMKGLKGRVKVKNIRIIQPNKK